MSEYIEWGPRTQDAIEKFNRIPVTVKPPTEDERWDLWEVIDEVYGTLDIPPVHLDSLDGVTSERITLIRNAVFNAGYRKVYDQ